MAFGEHSKHALELDITFARERGIPLDEIAESLAKLIMSASELSMNEHQREAFASYLSEALKVVSGSKNAKPPTSKSPDSEESGQIS